MTPCISELDFKTKKKASQGLAFLWHLTLRNQSN